MEARNIELPDWLGSGQDFFDTIQILKGKKINDGYMEMDYNFKFSDKFSYPVVFKIRNLEGDVVIDHIAFRVWGGKDDKQRKIEETITIPSVIRTLRRKDLINFFAEVIRNDIDFVLYLEEMPKKFRGVKFYELKENQKIVFNEKLIMEIMSCLEPTHSTATFGLDEVESIL
uniref:Uncharacterized protein n=1 Tax=candidate division WOR-3 bacterium TaxID=2052148 RepID=A0A7C4XE06_UNCW3